MSENVPYEGQGRSIVTNIGLVLSQDTNGDLGIWNNAGTRQFTFRANGNASWAGLITSANGITLAGQSFPLIVAAPAVATVQTGANTNFINFVPPAATGVYRILSMVNVTAWTTPASFTVVVTYKDDSGIARTETLGLTRGSTGATAAAITAVDRWYALSLLISIDNSATAITLSTSGTFTGSPSYSLAAVLERLI